MSVHSPPEIYVGLMSGTSLDGVDAIVADFAAAMPRVLGSAHVEFDAPLRATLLRLAAAGSDEIDTAHAVGLTLADLYAHAAQAAIAAAGVTAVAVRAIGCHGQTVRHRPERGYTVQLGNAAALAEHTGIAVVADFRAADLAAGGQGAPLAPGFHAAFMAHARLERVVLNLGGIANITRLAAGQPVIGFDCGPANILLDAWTQRHLGEPYDRDGNWARSGRVDPALLARLLDDPYFSHPPPKSTGRERFNLHWLEQRLEAPGRIAAADVQATLLALTARTVAQAIAAHCGESGELVVCGGGARNDALMQALAADCAGWRVRSSAELGLPPEAIEPLAFAWLARERLAGRPGNLPAVTGARGPRVLGAVHLPPPTPS